jgi:hypothetical protein
LIVPFRQSSFALPADQQDEINLHKAIMFEPGQACDEQAQGSEKRKWPLAKANSPWEVRSKRFEAGEPLTFE